MRRATDLVMGCAGDSLGPRVAAQLAAGVGMRRTMGMVRAVARA
jgi:hypothetical protein